MYLSDRHIHATRNRFVAWRERGQDIPRAPEYCLTALESNDRNLIQCAFDKAVSDGHDRDFLYKFMALDWRE